MTLVRNICLVVCLVVSFLAKGQIEPIKEAMQPTGTPRMEETYLSESKKIGSIAYNDAGYLTVSIRKEQNLTNLQVSKSISFSGATTEGNCDGYIDASEIAGGIVSLSYLNDSLLTKTPQNEIHFAKRFTNSYFVIYASIVPNSGTLFSKSAWDISFVLNEHDNAVTQCVVHVKKNEVPGYIKLLEIAREKLQDF